MNWKLILRNILFVSFLIFNFNLYGQQECSNYFENPIPSCACDDCGFIDPQWSLTNGESSVCEGETFEVSGAASTPYDNIETYHWYFIDPIANEIVYDELLYDTTYVDFAYVVTSDVPCTATAVLLNIQLLITSESCDEGESCRVLTTAVEVKLLPEANIDPVDPVCEDVAMIFSNSSCHATYYEWDFGDGTTSTLVNPPHIYDSPGTYEVTLTAYNDACDGSDQETIDVEVIGFPTADAIYSLDPTNGCTNLDVIFTNQQDDYEYYSSALWTIFPSGGWNFSDTIYNQSSWDNGITFYEPGTYVVTLTVTNICGMDVWVDSIQVFEEPVADLSFPNNYCLETAGATVSLDFCNFFTTLTGSTCGFNWLITNTTTGIQYTSTLDCPSFTFDEAGDYEVELVIDGCNCGDVTETSSFIIQTPVDITFDYPGDVICTNSDPFQITPNVNGGNWCCSPVVSTSGVFNPAAAIIGDNTICYSVGTGACESEDCLIINVVEEPNLSIIAIPTSCDSIQYIPSVTSSGTYTTETWYLILEDGSQLTYDAAVTNSIAITEPGEHQFVVELTGVCGQVTDTIPIEIITSISSVDAGVDDTLCISTQTYQLNGIPLGGTWSEIGGSGNGLDSSTGIIDLALAGGGSHQYEYVHAEGTECEISDIVNVEIVDFSGVSAGPDLTICEGSALVQLTGNPVSQGAWSGPGVTDPSGVFNPTLLAAGNSYILTYCVSNPSINCNACDEMTITINPLPEANFQIVGTNCVGEVLDIENLSTGGCSCYWDFGNGQTSTNCDPGPSYNTVGVYTITLIAGSCATTACYDTFIYPITVTEPAVADFTKSISEGCAVLDVTFNNLSFGTGVSYFWDFGDGQTSTEESPGTISFNQGNADTTYYITLSVTNGCGTIEFIDSVTVYPIPVVIFSPNVDDGCSPLEIEFSNISVGNPEICSWYIDGVLVSNACEFPNQIFTTTDTSITIYEVTLIVENFCGSDTLANTITVYPPNVDAFIYTDTTSGCQPLTVSFGNFSTPGAQVSWDFGDGNGSFETDPVYTFDTAGVFTVYQYASNCGTDVDSVVIEVFPAPEVSFSHAAYVCQGQPITFINESEDLSGSEWDFGDGATSFLDSPSHMFDSSGTYTVTLIGYSSLNNCTATFQSTVEVLGNPSISFTPSVLDGCAPLAIDFMNTSVGATYFEWDFGNGEVSSEDSPQNQIFNEPGTFEVTLIGTDVFGCFADTSVINIIVHEVPTANFTTNGLQYCSTVDLIETTNLSQGAVQYFWTFGNGSVLEDFEPNMIAADTGSLLINLIAVNGFTCSDTLMTSVEILGTPIAIAPISELEGCSPFEAQFGNASEFSDEYYWDFGENNDTSTEVEPVHIYNDAGDFVATLIAMNTNGCPSDTLEFNIFVYPLPVSDFVLSQDTVCGFGDTIFMTNNSAGATDYDWNFDNGQPNSNLFEPITSYSDTGTYIVSLITMNQPGCLDTAVQNLTVLGQPEAIIGANPLAACQPAVFNLSNNSNYSNSFEWDFGDGNINSTIPNPTHLYPDDDAYEVILIANNSNGCPSDMDTLLLTVYPKPVSDFELSDLMVCGLQDTVFTTNNSQGANDYVWNFGNGVTSVLTNPFVLYQNEGEYNVSLIVTNEFVCRDTMEQIVSVNLQPFAAFEPGTFLGCEPDTITFINNSIDADYWVWDFGNGITSEELNPIHVYPDAGLYDVQLIASYNESCFDTLMISNAVSILPSPIAAFSYIDLEDGKVQFINESIEATYYDWDLGNGDFSEEFSPFLEYNDNGNWQVILTATHLNGCMDMDTISVSPEIFFGLYLPNAMSPESGTGEARLFKPKGIGIEEYEVEVYSPWGQLLWKNAEQEGEQPKGSWDGSFKGTLVPQGVYVWKAWAKFINGHEYLETGTVSVLR